MMLRMKKKRKKRSKVKIFASEMAAKAIAFGLVY